MCGRTACTLAKDDLQERCKYRGTDGSIQRPAWRDGQQGYYPSSNISPHSYTPVLLSGKHRSTSGDSSSSTEGRVLQNMRWGLLPSWHKGNPKNFTFNMSNARRDTLLDKASFKGPLEKGRRCVILAEGFFEWQTKEKGAPKQPYYIYFKKDVAHECAGKAEKEEKTEVSQQLLGEHKELLTMAGLFDCWKAPKTSDNTDTEVVYSYSIITVDSSPQMQQIHHRMPAILDGEEEIQNWLDFEELPLKEAVELLTPKDCLQWHPVSTAVNNSRNKSPECTKPIDLLTLKEKSEKGTLLSWFKPSPKKDQKMEGTAEGQEPSPKKVKHE